MARVKGLAIPVGVDGSGGAAITSGAAQKKKIIISALAEGDDDNPFQNLGISSRIIFEINSVSTQAEAKLEISRILKKFRGKISVSPSDPIRVVQGKSPEEFGIAFKYIDLDTDKLEEFNEFFTKAGGTSG